FAFHALNFCSENKLEQKFLAQLIQGLSNNNTITHLDISQLYLCHAQELFVAFKENNIRLNKLDIRKNSFSTKTKKRLAEWIRQYDEPLEIDFRGHDSMRGNSGVPEFMIDAIMENEHITLLITEDQLNDEQIKQKLSSNIVVHE